MYKLQACPPKTGCFGQELAFQHQKHARDKCSHVQSHGSFPRGFLTSWHMFFKRQDDPIHHTDKTIDPDATGLRARRYDVDDAAKVNNKTQP